MPFLISSDTPTNNINIQNDLSGNVSNDLEQDKTGQAENYDINHNIDQSPNLRDRNNDNSDEFNNSNLLNRVIKCEEINKNCCYILIQFLIISGSLYFYYLLDFDIIFVFGVVISSEVYFLFFYIYKKRKNILSLLNSSMFLELINLIFSTVRSLYI